MINELDHSKQIGKFTINSKQDVFGELTFSGKDTLLYLRGHTRFKEVIIPNGCIKGPLHDLTKVTLLDCIYLEQGSSSGEDESYCYASIFPNYILRGNCHIDHNEEKINGIHFVIDDAKSLFQNRGAFGSIQNAHPFIEQIVDEQEKRLGYKIPIGSYPVLFYFTGKHEIFSLDTDFGTIHASHCPIYNNLQIEDTVLIGINFKQACNFKTAFSHAWNLTKYLEVLIGRPQSWLRFNLCVNDSSVRPSLLEVYCSYQPKYTLPHDKKQTRSPDVLLEATGQTDIFGDVLNAWFSRHKERHDARLRFSTSFTEDQYTVDRLIRSANMFDILPSEATPRKVKLSDELEQAKKDCQEIFKALPLSLERDGILSALGRVGKSSLKHKIRYRAQILVDMVGEDFPDLFLVTDEAVICRNHYVHGSSSKIDYSNETNTIIFLTETLEFVFATSDLIEAKWDIKTWCKRANTTSHPFSKYRNNYKENLSKLQSLKLN
jgi:ApeA N-terminal domain 1